MRGSPLQGRRATVNARYDSSDAYIKAVRQHADRLVEQRLMLPDDVGFVVEAAPPFPVD
ncbi:hypothetical protein GCM10010082_02750 [Kushneria pakistanensis]|uniref:Alpha/beta hydrolase domain-containing protein n=1 Tax=Kushneria pakistanensis TaxID=1508770 RepID=A0ABQ3FAE3_9GAMM|nr:alpha/beta hydrolase domain-containing protein [Kushneria pakistanensis]GHC15600.1 hypothetical protein GCM10010082_02750 [Kushneria pakistanensis]